MTRLPGSGERPWLVAAFSALVGLALLGAAWFVWRSGTEPEMEIIRKADEITTAKEEWVVDVGGEVVKPGVYKVKDGDRVGDVIGLAGGFTDQADVKWVELHINKAEKVVDGYKLYIPSLSSVETNTFAGKNTQTIVSINFATQVELEGLPGIGKITAEKIIQGRPYNLVRDLREKKVVTEKVFEQIEHLVGL